MKNQPVATNLWQHNGPSMWSLYTFLFFNFFFLKDEEKSGKMTKQPTGSCSARVPNWIVWLSEDAIWKQQSDSGYMYDCSFSTGYCCFLMQSEAPTLKKKCELSKNCLKESAVWYICCGDVWHTDKWIVYRRLTVHAVISKYRHKRLFHLCMALYVFFSF